MRVKKTSWIGRQHGAIGLSASEILHHSCQPWKIMLFLIAYQYRMKQCTKPLRPVTLTITRAVQCIWQSARPDHPCDYSVSNFVVLVIILTVSHYLLIYMTTIVSASSSNWIKQKVRDSYLQQAQSHTIIAAQES
jgi:hypothetical protein